MWADKLQTGSFRGVEFDVTRMSDEARRSASIAEVPYANGGEVEDLGLSARRIHVSAILWTRGSSDYMAQLDALETALSAAGPGRLVHPIYGTIERAVCLGWRIGHEADNRDGCALEMEFVRSAVTARPELGTVSTWTLPDRATAAGRAARAASGRALLSSIMRAALGAKSTLLGIKARLTSTLANFVGIAKGFNVKSLLSGFDSILHPRAWIADFRSVIDSTIASLGLGELAGGARSAASATTGTSAASPEEIYAAVGDAGLVGDTAAVVASTGMADLIALSRAWAPDVIAPATDSPADKIIVAHALTEVASGLVDASMTVLAADLSRPSPALTRDDVETAAEIARSSVVTAIAALEEASTPETAGEVIAATTALRASASYVLDVASIAIERRPPVVLRTAAVTGPVRLLAHSLYGSHERANELRRLNPDLARDLVVQRGDTLYAYAR